MARTLARTRVSTYIMQAPVMCTACTVRGLWQPRENSAVVPRALSDPGSVIVGEPEWANVNQPVLGEDQYSSRITF